MITDASGISFLRKASTASAASRRSTGGCDHHGIEHDMARLPARQRLRDRIDAGGLRHHADLHRADLEIGKHGVDLRDDEFGGHRVDAGDAARILRRQRRDRGGAIDAERGKGLQVGLDAGAAARIGAGDGERHGRRHGAIFRVFETITRPSAHPGGPQVRLLNPADFGLLAARYASE
ncbi:hypothetical protein ACVWZR_007045 [Bradyrhizobium sp. i1.3.1]